MKTNFDKKCELCEEYRHNRPILYDSDNFFITPSLGQIVEGYLLICTKEHYIGLAHLSDGLFDELVKLKFRTKGVLSEYYNTPIFFEHGPVSPTEKGGCCVEHAHLHVVPVKVDIFNDIKSHFDPKKIESLHVLAEQAKKGVPYFYYEDQKGEKYLFELYHPVPSQYLRRLIAVKIGRKEKWDWREYPGFKEFNSTFDKLKGKW